MLWEAEKAKEEREEKRKWRGGGQSVKYREKEVRAKVYDDPYDEVLRKLSSFGNDYPII